MKLLGFASKKGGGKNTSSNYIFGSMMVNLGLCLPEHMKINDVGQLVVSYIKEDSDEVENVIVDPLSPNVEAQRFFESNVWPWCKIYSFADPLKAVCCQILGLDPKQCYGNNDDKNSLTELLWENMPRSRTGKRTPVKTGKMTAREVLQYVGTEIFRQMDDDVWVKATLSRIEKEEPQLAIISDVRFPNEVEGIQAAGGKVIKLLRAPYADGDQHPSETVLDDKPDDYFDAIIDNRHSQIDKNNEQVRDTLIEFGWGKLTKDGE